VLLFGIMGDMNAEANTHAPTSSTDVKFWCYLAPFLLGSVALWGGLVWWLLHKGPVVIARFVNLLTAWA
jgi:hypothetical protein